MTCHLCIYVWHSNKISASCTFYTWYQYLLYLMSIFPSYEVMAYCPYLWSHGMIIVMPLTIIKYLKLFYQRESFCFTQPGVSWAQVGNSSPYNILKNLIFLKIEQFLKTVQGAWNFSEDITRRQIWVKSTDQNCTMANKTQNNHIKSEGEFPAIKHSKLQKQSIQGHPSYQLRGRGGNEKSGNSGNSGRGRRNLCWGSTNWAITPNQAFFGKCEELSREMFCYGRFLWSGPFQGNHQADRKLCWNKLWQR